MDAATTTTTTTACISPQKRARTTTSISSEPKLLTKYEAAKAKRDAVMAKNAQQMLELAEKALAAVQEMMALESAVREEAGSDEAMFGCDDDRTLEDAEMAICFAHHTAEKYCEKEK